MFCSRRSRLVLRQLPEHLSLFLQGFLILPKLYGEPEKHYKVYHKQDGKGSCQYLPGQCDIMELYKQIWQDNQEKNTKQRNHASPEYPFHHFKPGGVITEDFFLFSLHFRDRLSKITVPEKILHIFPSAVRKYLNIF